MTDTTLQSIISRIVRCEESKRECAEDIKEIISEAKSHGFDPKVIRRTVKLRMETDEKRTERERIEREADEMEAALGLFVQTPLGESAVERVRSLTPKVSRERVVERL